MILSIFSDPGHLPPNSRRGRARCSFMVSSTQAPAAQVRLPNVVKSDRLLGSAFQIFPRRQA